MPQDCLIVRLTWPSGSLEHFHPVWNQPKAASGTGGMCD
jgi:hypothetical protein